MDSSNPVNTIIKAESPPKDGGFWVSHSMSVGDPTLNEWKKVEGKTQYEADVAKGQTIGKIVVGVAVTAPICAVSAPAVLGNAIIRGALTGGGIDLLFQGNAILSGKEKEINWVKLGVSMGLGAWTGPITDNAINMVKVNLSVEGILGFGNFIYSQAIGRIYTAPLKVGEFAGKEIFIKDDH